MRQVSSWYSERLGRDMTVARWGHYGTPLLLFPTAGGDAEEVERNGVIGALGGLLEAGQIKVYSCDSAAGQAWTSGAHSWDHCCAYQRRFEAFVDQELVPAIHQDCRSPGHTPGLEVIAAGASIGAFNAVASLCRDPRVFKCALAMSGSYDIEKLFGFVGSRDLYQASPLLYLPDLSEEPRLERLRRRFVLFASGEGHSEDLGESWRMAGVLGAKGVPNRVDSWGPDYHHDWPTWREMLPGYLAEQLGLGY